MTHCQTDASLPLSDWMAALDDSRALQALTLAGSHDTCAYTVDDALARTQSAPLDAQLRHGVRVLDIRCRHERDLFHINHGGIPLGLMFDDVLDDCARFLAAHPGEAIVMSVKDECGPRACTRTFAQTFAAYRQRHARLRWRLEPVASTLGAARGAIVLLRRFASGQPLGLDASAWPDNASFTIDAPGAAFSIQDEYRVPVRASLDYKWRAIDALLADTARLVEAGRWVVNFCSGTGMGANPSVVALGDAASVGIHARLAARLAACAGPCGTLLFDFCDDRDWALVRALVERNRRAADGGG
ncbi:phosphatidylinositol-specific phospholipase C [Burkholderia sp. FERM BP-3421]|jgi:1-phosphatidylinositol phosphodiesterase|uniref:phosphatidylinositol-specific phospholipase C n=1 Tax=Burkholderia sp. FERM BP-3421 TaxID=1494466 RepID=UPI00235F6AAE|nr:phosphatidylinositol-specific phospholipase C [Burkholderia sp. FERM BP-3421]WDD92242.1 phosphatidylinositol-specific phospholipase C [Burkholderia sp. FERM BP-3421]